MPRKFLSGFLAIFFLVVGTSFAIAADSKQPYLRDEDFTAQQLSQFEVDLPHDLDPGYHELIVEVYNDAGVVENRILPFCKALDGRAHWDGVCPGMDYVINEKKLDSITKRSQLPNYNAAQEPKKQIETFIVLLVILSLILRRANTLKHPDHSLRNQIKPKQLSGDGSQQGELVGVENSLMAKPEDVERWGDRSWTYRLLPGYKKVDAVFDRGPLAVDRISPLLARAMCDGDYLRAIFGTLTLALYIFAGVGAFFASKSIGFQALPPQVSWAIALALVGVADSFAGIIASVLYFCAVLFTGHISSIGELLTTIGVATLFFAPALIACAVRPFRRETADNHERWELATDLALAPLMGGWATQKIIIGLSGFSQLQLSFSKYANLLAIIVGVAIFVRILVEDGSLRLYPRRIVDVCSDLEEPYLVQKLISLVLKGAAFYFLAGLYIGYNKFLFVGTALFVIPLLLRELLEGKVPQSTRLYRLFPTGTVLAILLIMFGIYIAEYVLSLFTSTLAYFRWTFICVAIAVFIFQVIDLFAEESKEAHWRTRSQWQLLMWRLGGVMMYALLACLAFGVDVPGYFRGLIFG